MNEEEHQKPERSRGGAFMRGCGIVVGVVALIFFFIVGTCFIG